LIEAIQATAAGKASPAIAALARGVAVNGFIKKAMLGIALVTTAAVIGIGLGNPRTTTAGPQPEKSSPAKTETAEQKKTTSEPADAPPATRTITGKVIDPDGKP